MTGKQTKIKLSKLDREAVVIEEAYEFNDSIFNLVYQKTEILIQNIIKENKNYNNNYSHNSIKKELENIISFEGRRGTGKSSAMRSVQEALRNYKNNNFLKNTDNGRGCTNDYYFHVIEAIDASTLEKEESILEVVLASMFVDFRNKVDKIELLEKNEYESRELYQLFGNIFEILMNIRDPRKTNNYKDGSPLHVLSQMSNSRILSEKMQELVKRYLGYMNPSSRASNCDANSFLVITVDDLDMHFKEGYTSYQLLESIHRYFMIPNVIVFVSYSYLDLCVACEQYFIKLCPDYLSDIDKRVQKMAVEYLSKVCPIYSRVHLPSLRKKDYQEEETVKVIITKDEGKDIFNNFYNILWDGNSNSEIEMSAKKFILLLKASLAGLYYDARGEKRHFAEADDLRSLSQTYTFYKQLMKIQNSQNGSNQAVFKELLDDLYFRFAGEKLIRDDYEQFRKFLDVTIERRSRDILEDLHQIINADNDYFPEEPEEYSKITYCGHYKEPKHSYSYGELLYFLYRASKEKIYPKELIWCILESYTIMLTKLYKQLVSLNDGERANCEEKQKIRKKITSIIGTSVASSWSNIYMPSLLLTENEKNEDKKENKEIGENEGSKRGTENYNVLLEDPDQSVNAAAIKGNWVSGIWTYNVSASFGDKKLSEIKEIIKEDFQILEILCMFITGVFEENTDDIYKKRLFTYHPGTLDLAEEERIKKKNAKEKNNKNSDNKDEILGPRMELSFDKICFNILNFTNNLFVGEEFFINIHKELVPEYVKYFKNIQKVLKDSLDKEIIVEEVKYLLNKEITDKEVENYLDNISLKKDVIEWSKRSCGFAFPLYSFDMMYNIFKRNYQRQGNIPPSTNVNIYWNYVKKVYDNLGALLKEEDEFYFGTHKKDYKFYNNYKLSPFINFIDGLEHKNSKERKKKFVKAFIDMISAMAHLS